MHLWQPLATCEPRQLTPQWHLHKQRHTRIHTAAPYGSALLETSGSVTVKSAQWPTETNMHYEWELTVVAIQEQDLFQGSNAELCTGWRVCLLRCENTAPAAAFTSLCHWTENRKSSSSWRRQQGQGHSGTTPQPSGSLTLSYYNEGVGLNDFKQPLFSIYML